MIALRKWDKRIEKVLVVDNDREAALVGSGVLTVPTPEEWGLLSAPTPVGEDNVGALPRIPPAGARVVLARWGRGPGELGLVALLDAPADGDLPREGWVTSPLGLIRGAAPETQH